jgi:hypothetical protein
MALPKAIKKDEFEKSIPEVAREHYSLDEATGEYHLGLVPKGELAQFRDNNITLQKQLKEQAEKFKDVDPEEYKKLMARVKELESGNGHKNIDEELNKRTEAMKKSHADEVAKLSTSNKDLNNRLTHVLVNQKLSEIALSKEVGIKPEALSTLQILAERVWSLDEKGNPVAKDGENVMYGTDGKPLEMKAWIVELKKTHGYLFNEPTGGGAKPGAPNPQGLKRSGMTTKQKSDYIGTHGREAYESLPE